MTPYSSDGYNHEVEVYIQEGWNLILMPDPDLEERIFLPDSEITQDDLKTLYVYVASHKKYYQGYPDQSDFIEAFYSLSKDEQSYLHIGSAWVYSDKAGYFRYKRTDVPKYNEVSLTKGWNFFTMTPGLMSKRLKDFRGGCNITKMAIWEDQQWNVLTPNHLAEHAELPSDWDDFVPADSESDIGRGILIKVTDLCAFGPNIPSPPPNLPD